jgi:hypothetical protein
LPPYTAKRETTTVRKLPDGTTITHVTVSFVARDGDGRMRTETTRTLADGTTAQFVSISDPGAGVNYSWSVSTSPAVAKVVTANHYLSTSLPPVPMVRRARRYYPYRSESLPPQTIDGLYAEGFRTTRTTPAGYDGNDQDIVVTTESWNTPDLGIQLREITDDPRNGKSTTEVSDLQQTAPDPALFKLPEGYEVKEFSR